MGKKRRILFICPYPEGVAPSQRLKYEQYFSYFRENGIEVNVSSFMTKLFWRIVYKRGFIIHKTFWTFFGYLRRIYDLFRLPFYDIVYVHLWVTPFGPPIFEYFYSKMNKNIIYDIDDMIFLAPASIPNKFMANFKGKFKMQYLMKVAKHVIVCTPKLEAYVKQFNLNTTDISSTINTDIYIAVNNYEGNNQLTLGWSGSHSTSKYFYLLDEVLTDLSKEFKFNVLVIGDPSFRFKTVNVEAIPWNYDSEVQDLQRIDIGLYPLPDEEWVYGKSGLKALQYMALGLPTVATGIGANFRVIEDGVNGFLVNNREEWIERIRMLIEQPPLRKKIGQNARKSVEKKFSILANRDVYLEIILRLLK